MPILARLFSLTFAIVSGFALSPAKAENEIDVFVAHYQDNTGLSVFSPVISWLHELSDAFSVNGRFNYETFNKTASNNGSAMDAISGATTVVGGSGSGFSETRIEPSAGIAYKRGSWNTNVNTSMSNESHFQSRSIAAGIERETFQRNLTLSINYAYTADQVEVNSASQGVSTQQKQTQSILLGATQLLGPKDLLSVGFGYANISGYQSGPLRKISIDENLSGSIVSYIYDESHPTLRNRALLYLQYKSYFQTRTALVVNTSVYRDDWGINAFAIESRLAQYIIDTWRIAWRYRFYYQDAADFYRPLYTQEQDLMTADARLRRFNTHLTGISATWSPAKFNNDWSIRASLDYYLENDGFTNAIILSLHTGIRF
ncbi:MAG: DUF3570 domain-containing protein [Gammaproteobacteria bacterium]|nr:DUF3570 domain-containing protein [Gammaproteobacteria bacterium]